MIRSIVVFCVVFLVPGFASAAQAIASNENYDKIEQTSAMIRDLERRIKANGDKIDLLVKKSSSSVPASEASVSEVPVQLASTPQEAPMPVVTPQASVQHDDVYLANIPLKEEHTVEVGTEISHIAYEEPDVMDEKGMFYGIYGLYEFRPQGKDWLTPFVDVFHADMHLNFGMIEYDGSGTIDDVADYMIEPRLWVGKDLVLGQSILTPYVGIGYRWLYDSLGGEISSTGAAGYDRQSQYFYLPLGASYAFPLVQGWNLALNAEYDILLKGYQDSYISDLPNSTDLKNTQDEGYGIRGSIKLTKTSDRFNLIVEPYIRYWNIEESDEKIFINQGVPYIGWEPHNKSTEIGARVGVEF